MRKRSRSRSLRVRQLRRRLKISARDKRYYASLEFQLCEVLSSHLGERGHEEGAVDTLCRIISERDRALTFIALDKIKRHDVF